MKLTPLRPDLQQYLHTHRLVDKWAKAARLLAHNTRHPSLHLELLEPRWHGIYSFRLDRKYRALFLIKNGQAEVFQITNHYRKS